MKILNLYAGIGGNRKLWGKEHEITAIEINPQIAKIYKNFFPNDKVIVTDAHEYLLKHYKEFDFIWSSPPCPTHSRLNFLNNNKKGERGIYPKFPNMKLYEEIIFLKYWFKGNWVIENVISYYKPLIKPKQIGRHYYWSNFIIEFKEKSNQVILNRNDITLKNKMEFIDIIVTKFHGYKGDKRTLINNCVEPKTGLNILNCAFKDKQRTLSDLK